MAPRVDSELLLVGSLPAGSADSALRAAGGFFGDLVFALPDGETGPRSAWVGYERERLVRPNPGVLVVQETESPTGIPRHAYETPVFGLAPGVTELHWDSWPRIDDAIAGYQVFSALRAEGVIPPSCGSRSGCRFRPARDRRPPGGRSRRLRTGARGRRRERARGQLGRSCSSSARRISSRSSVTTMYKPGRTQPPWRLATIETPSHVCCVANS
jgi:hypothetical protein